MDIATLQRLAGINEFKGFTPYEGSILVLLAQKNVG